MEKIQDMVISVAEKEGWAVTIEEQNELRITFNFAKFTPQGQDFSFSTFLPTLLTMTTMCFWKTSLNITRTTTPTMKHIYGLVLTDTDRMVRHTTLRILWRI